MEISVRTNIDEAIRIVGGINSRHIPFALSKAMLDTVRTIYKEEQGTMRTVLDRPRPFTLSSIYYRAPTKDQIRGDSEITAEVRFKDFAGKGVSAGRYLKPQVEGGSRVLKAGERLLQRSGILPQGYFITPGPGARLDAFGNIPGAKWVQVISFFRSFGETGFTANRAAGAKGTGRKQAQFFVVRPGDGSSLPLGIYERSSRGIALIMNFVESVQYRKRFAFYDIANSIAAREFPDALIRALRYAIATER